MDAQITRDGRTATASWALGSDGALSQGWLFSLTVLQIYSPGGRPSSYLLGFVSWGIQLHSGPWIDHLTGHSHF